jgi:hypothetical protein
MEKTYRAGGTVVLYFSFFYACSWLEPSCIFIFQDFMARVATTLSGSRRLIERVAVPVLYTHVVATETQEWDSPDP